MDEKSYIATCKTALSKKYQLDPMAMKERDFEFVSQKVRAATKVDLSTATLRRIWAGKYQQTPQIKTLDALAQALGHRGWHEFKIHQGTTSKKGPDKKKQHYRWLLLPVFVGILWAGIHLIDGNQPANIHFQAETNLHEGVPATIGFNYDIREIAGPVEIQLSWNPYERTTLDPEKQFYTGTYFYPDYHEAKLIRNDEILTSTRVHITTPGWYALLMRDGYDPYPLPVPENDFLKENRMVVTSALADAMGIASNGTYFTAFTLSNVGLDSLLADELSLVFNAQLLPMVHHQHCRSMDILIKGADHRLRIPIGETGCHGLLNLYAGETTLSGKTTDLSNLSTDLSAPTPVSIQSKGKTLIINVGENDPFEVSFREKLGPVKVIKFIAMGPVDIDTVVLE